MRVVIELSPDDITAIIRQGAEKIARRVHPFMHTQSNISTIAPIGGPVTVTVEIPVDTLEHEE